MAINTRAAAAALAAAALLVGCAGMRALMPAPAIYVGDTAKRLFTGAGAAPATTAIDLLFVTDRAAATAADAALPYASDRSRSMVFGSVSVDPAVSSDLIAVIRYGLAPGAPGRPLEEIQRPFWRIPARP